MLYLWVRLIIVTVHMNLVELLKWQLNYSLLLNDISSYTVTWWLSYIILAKIAFRVDASPGLWFTFWNYPTICSLTKQRVVHLSYLRKEGRKLFNACALCFGPIFSFATIYCFGSCRTLCLSERDFHLYKFYVT